MPVTNPAAIHYPISLLDVGDSFFVPALHAGGHIHKLRKMADTLGITIDYVMGVDLATGLYGIRVIRTT